MGDLLKVTQSGAGRQLRFPGGYMSKKWLDMAYTHTHTHHTHLHTHTLQLKFKDVKSEHTHKTPTCRALIKVISVSD